MSTRLSIAISTLILGTQALTMNAMAQSADSTPAAAKDRGAMDSKKMDHDKMDHGKMDQGKMDKTPVTAQSFATKAATTDMAEIELAQLAMTNSQDEAVKKFAAQMVKDHTATSAKLKSIAAKDNLALPTALDAEHAAVKTKLSGLKGQDFDRAYGMEMAKGHDKAVALFESASQTPAVTGDLKQFATATLPKLREHKGMAHDLHGKEGA